MYQTKNLGLNITEIDKDSLQAFNFDTDLGDNFKAIDEKTLSHRNITNCLLEAPQDIKLEIVDGVITLKEGSKVYVPNGPGIFEERTTSIDLTATSTTNGQGIIYLNQDGALVVAEGTSKTVSGATDSLVGRTWHVWYDTTNNKIVRYRENVETPDYQCSFPLALITVYNDAISSIDQVFNGFGYIGSTVFALPGVKGLVPNGRNTDGSLKNTIYDVANVSTYTWNSSYSGTFENFILTNNQIAGNGGWAEYREKENLLWNKDINSPFSGIPIIELTILSGAITSFTPKLPFHAVDYFDYQTKITELETKIATLQAAVEALQGS